MDKNNRINISFDFENKCDIFFVAILIAFYAFSILYYKQIKNQDYTDKSNQEYSQIKKYCTESEKPGDVSAVYHVEPDS